MLGSMKKGSFTIEAAVLVPLLLLIFMMAMQIAIHLYQEACTSADNYLSDQMWVVETFYKDDVIGGYLHGEN